MTDFQAVAKQFVDFYYNTFDTNRAGLQALYRDQSMLTFETSQTLGAASIKDKLVELPFQKVVHKISTLDAQPSTNNAIIVLVTGQLIVDDQPQPMNYCQTFFLHPEGGSYFVYNDVFKLVYG